LRLKGNNVDETEHPTPPKITGSSPGGRIKGGPAITMRRSLVKG